MCTYGYMHICTDVNVRVYVWTHEHAQVMFMCTTACTHIV